MNAVGQSIDCNILYLPFDNNFFEYTKETEGYTIKKPISIIATNKIKSCAITKNVKKCMIIENDIIKAK